MVGLLIGADHSRSHRLVFEQLFAARAVVRALVAGLLLPAQLLFQAFELTPRAATPGKRALGMRVAMRDGGPLTAEAIFARNAMRELEVFLPLSLLAAPGIGIDAWVALMGLVWCGVFVLFPLFNRDRLRVGDLVAGTWVVRAPKRVLDIDLAANPRGQLHERGARRLWHQGTHRAGGGAAPEGPRRVAAVATRIRAKIGVRAEQPDLEFLQAYYTALRGRLESRLLFGRRRRDKFDKA